MYSAISISTIYFAPNPAPPPLVALIFLDFPEPLGKSDCLGCNGWFGSASRSAPLNCCIIMRRMELNSLIKVSTSNNVKLVLFANSLRFNNALCTSSFLPPMAATRSGVDRSSGVIASMICSYFLNFCSTKEEQEFLMELSEIIKKQNPHFTYKHIYIAIIYIYYGLILNEQPEDYLDNNIIKYITSNYSNINKLIYEIVSSEQDYAVIIRRSFFQMELNY